MFEDAARDAGRTAGDAFAELRTNGERLVDRVQTSNDPAAKQQLLDTCRDALARLRREGSNAEKRVDNLCTSIRETDPNTPAAWDGIRQRMNEIRRQKAGASGC
ncbi:MAG: hypothetical protein U0531_02875 [Dehalococcoidia bacterium]